MATPTKQEPVNRTLFARALANIASLPRTPTSSRKKAPSPPSQPNEGKVNGEEPTPPEDTTETSTTTHIDPYPTQSASRMPSSFFDSVEFKRTAFLLQKYPSLSLVKQISSCRLNGDSSGRWKLDKELSSRMLAMKQMSSRSKLMDQQPSSRMDSAQHEEDNPGESKKAGDEEEEEEEVEKDDRKPAAAVETIITEDPVLEGCLEVSNESGELSVDPPEGEEANWEDTDIEVMPGVMKRLRGSDETLHAFEYGECIEVVCMACTVHLACIMDCEAVICPVCLSMSPLENGVHNDCVGLGLQMD